MLGTVDDNPIAGFNDIGRDQNATPNMFLRVCRQPNLMPNKDKSLFQCSSIPFFWEVIS